MTAVGLQSRLGLYAWAREAAAGRLKDLSWVDAQIRDDGRPFLLTSPEAADEPKFRHVPYGLFLPPAMLTQARDAQQEGEPTALEGLMLLFAQPEWLIESRRLFWTPLSPVPRLLAPLVEAYGIDAELHKGDPQRLVRLLAHLPVYYPHRGQLSHALSLLVSATGESPALREAGVSAQGSCFTCHDARWWQARGLSHEALHIANGVVRLAPGTKASQKPEDVVISTQTSSVLPHAVLRLLPVWTNVQLQALGEP